MKVILVILSDVFLRFFMSGGSSPFPHSLLPFHNNANFALKKALFAKTHCIFTNKHANYGNIWKTCIDEEPGPQCFQEKEHR
jgi:hypothetical protein